MHFTCRSFIGKNTAATWSQYWENEPDDQLKFTKGHLFGLINLQGDESTNLSTVGRDLIFEINQNYFSQESLDINLALKKTLLSISQNPIFSNHQISLVLAIILNKQVFIALFGEGYCFLQRDSRISLLLTGQNNQITSICGPIQDKDRLMLTSSQFYQFITWDKIKTILIDQKIQNIEENFLSLLYSTDNQFLLSSVLIEINQDIQTIIPSTINPPLESNENIDIVPTETILNLPQVDPLIPKKNFLNSIFVKHQSNYKIGNHKKIQIIIALLLIIGLLISSYFGYRKNLSLKIESNFQSLKDNLEKKINNISVIKGLDLETANQTAKEAKEIINQMSVLKIHQDMVSQYRSQVDNFLAQTGDSDNFSPQMVYDTSLIVDRPSFSKIIFYQQNLYLLDSDKGRMDNFNPQAKSTKNIVISDLIKKSNKILVDNNNLYIVSDRQLFTVEKNTLTPKFDFNSLETSPTITDVQFWNGSLYVLDNYQQSIWKLTPNATGFSSQPWLKNNLKLELGAESLAIDGRLWVLTKSGQINLYVSGLKDNFKFNQSLSFTKTFSLNAVVDSDFLIFIDDSKYIYVYKKNGEFKFKYNLGQLKVLDLTFDSVQKIIYFLASDQKIYQITL